MKLKKILALVLALCSLLMCAACGGTTDGPGNINIDTGKTYTLTIYRARDSGMTDGERDEAVKAAIEEKFYNDTGIKIVLDVKIYTNTQITDIVDVNFNNKNKNIDGIIHYLSEDTGSAITKYAKDVESVIDLDPVLAQYGSNILAAIQKNDTDNIADRSGYFPYDGEYYRTALTSFVKEGGFGILMRKDLMAAVQSKTGLDPDDYDITNPGYKSMTVSEFEKVMRAIKEDSGNDVSIPVVGAPWDLQRTVATAFGVDTMSGFGLDANGKFVPQQFTPNWSKYVDLMYNWSKDGIWESESNNVTDDQRQTWFVAGTAAAYLAYPTAEQLINLSKKFYAANTGSEELMIIAPFASENEKGESLYDESGKQIVNGNLKTFRSFYGMIMPYRSENYPVLVKFLDWTYSKAENYELCQYGVKGVDWVEGDDFVSNGVTYKTWAYPSDKVDEYLVKAPYAGKYLLLPNINVSDRICAHYNTTEKLWYTELYYQFPQFGSPETEGIWMPEAPRQFSTAVTELDGQYVDEIRSYAWVGLKNQGKTPTQLLQEYLGLRNTYADYFTWIDQQYQSGLRYFADKYAK
ncbi:MAG: hypothetical protein E7461_03160 [Ruminococcaceae bacterium]|nr:hypothetical protein [Oscillospiraceae bacterium]